MNSKANEAREALSEAHAACFNHPDRPAIGMSHGPFSGVNRALGIIKLLENENEAYCARIAQLETTLYDAYQMAGRLAVECDIPDGAIVPLLDLLIAPLVKDEARDEGAIQ